MIKRLPAELRREFPDMTGLSATNLQYIRAFAAEWPAEPFPHRLFSEVARAGP